MIDTTKSLTRVNYAGSDIPFETPVDDYTRPADWLSIPAMDGTTDDIYILYGVSDYTINDVSFNIRGVFTIDWGDGTVESKNYPNIDWTISHSYNYDDIPSSSWTTHNNTKQVLIHLHGTRGQITRFVPYSPNLGTGATSYIYQISSNVESAYINLYNSGYGYKHRYIEIFEMVGANTVTDYSQFFRNCSSLRKVTMDTSNATNMTNMFFNCNKLVVAPTLNTSNVTSMSYMFNNCWSLKYAEFTDVSKVEDTSGMFYYCYSLKEVKGLNTKNSTSLYYMFMYCPLLEKTPEFFSNSATSFYQLFLSCNNLKKLFPYNMDNITSFSSFLGNNGDSTEIEIYPNMNWVGYDQSYINLPWTLKKLTLYNFNPSRTDSIAIYFYGRLAKASIVLDFFNSLPDSPAGTRNISFGSSEISRLGLNNYYVKDSGELYTIILATSDTVVDQTKTYYTYDIDTDTYTVASNVDFTSSTIYFEERTATWNKYVECESTDTGAETIMTYITNKGYTVS